MYQVHCIHCKQVQQCKGILGERCDKALRKLGYTMKVMSTVAYQAFTERNLNCHHLYWTWPWPLGIHGTPRRLFIEGDEFRLHLISANNQSGLQGFGKVLV
jgi:hypothetical protein